jgi:hypothetical protein
MIDISVLDFTLINILSYIGGVASGIILFYKYKDKLIIIKSKSSENLTSMNRPIMEQPIDMIPVVASAPPPQNNPIKITVDR